MEVRTPSTVPPMGHSSNSLGFVVHTSSSREAFDEAEGGKGFKLATAGAHRRPQPADALHNPCAIGLLGGHCCRPATEGSSAELAVHVAAPTSEGTTSSTTRSSAILIILCSVQVSTSILDADESKTNVTPMDDQ